MNESRLLRLPPELRNRIYTDVLVEPKGISVYRPDELDPEHCWEAPALLQVCRQIREEASSICYGLNTFRFHAPIQLEFGESAHREAIHRHSRLKRIKFSDLDCKTVLSAWLILWGQRTSSFLRTIGVDDTYYPIDEIEERIVECREHLKRKGVPVPAATIAVELLSEDKGSASGVWLCSAFDEALGSLSKDRERQEDYIADPMGAKQRWDW